MTLENGLRSDDNRGRAGDDSALVALGDRIAQRAALIDSALHAFLTDLRVFDEQEGWQAMGAQSCAHWPSWRVGIDAGAGREKVRVARALGALPKIDDALRTGALVRLEVTLTADEAAMVVRACELAAPEGDHATGLCTLAEATLRNGRLVDGATAEASIESTPQQQRQPVDILLHIDAATLSGQLENGHGVSAETSRRLPCDAGIVAVLTDAEGHPLDVGRKRRSVPAALRRALSARDRGCRFPGCTHRLVDAHHVHHWVDGGETSLKNLVSLCRFHHGLLHEAGYRLEQRADGTLAFFTPRNVLIAEAPAASAPSQDAVDLLQQTLTPDGLHYRDADRPRWDGDALDYESIIDALCQADDLH